MLCTRAYKNLVQLIRDQWESDYSQLPSVVADDAISQCQHLFYENAAVFMTQSYFSHWLTRSYIPDY